MAFSTGGKGGPNSEINVTPLVDVVLVLLIIFMVVTPLLQVNLDADIPKPPEEDIPPPENPEDQVVISLKENGDVFVNQDQITGDAELAAKLQLMMKSRKDKIAFLSGTENLEFGRVVTVMDIARGAGVSRVGIIDPL